MKKSFLKRLTAAIVAVPVAMTQTVLFTSFAAGETTTSSDTLDVQSVFNINTNTAKLVAASAFKSAAETRFNAKELGYENAYVQDSAWNEKVISVLNSRDGNSYNISAESLADSIEGVERAHQVLRDALGDKNTKATAYVTDKAVEIVAEFDYDYAEALKLQIEDMVRDFDLNIQKNELAKINNLKGTVTVTLDITDLKNKSVNVVADVDINGKKKGIKDAENYIDALHEELVKALASDATASVDTDAKKARVLSAVDAADKSYHFYKDKVDNVDGVVDWTTSKPLADADSVLAELKTKWKKAPGSLAAIQNNRWFNRCDKILSALVDEINKQDGKKTVSVTMSDLVDMAKKGSDFQAYVHADAYNYVGQGEVLFYVTDEDFTAADQAQVKTFFESQKEIAAALAEKNEVIDNVYSVKVVEADAALNGLSDEDAVTTAEASGSMDVYRIVWFDTKPNETDTKAETPTATDQVETPTATDQVETPTATDQVETPTATDQVE
nr:hypothetical protein [Oscillospiraceae bacterium]